MPCQLLPSLRSPVHMFPSSFPFVLEVCVWFPNTRLPPPTVAVIGYGAWLSEVCAERPRVPGLEGARGLRTGCSITPPHPPERPCLPGPGEGLSPPPKGQSSLLRPPLAQHKNSTLSCPGPVVSMGYSWRPRAIPQELYFMEKEGPGLWARRPARWECPLPAAPYPAGRALPVSEGSQAAPPWACAPGTALLCMLSSSHLCRRPRS